MLKGTCEICGEPTQIEYYELKDVTQPEDEWRYYKHTGVVHRRCKQHPLHLPVDGYPNERTRKYNRDGSLR